MRMKKGRVEFEDRRRKKAPLIWQLQIGKKGIRKALYKEKRIGYTKTIICIRDVKTR